MKLLSTIFLCCLLLTACSDDDKEQDPILVTNIVVTDADKVFKPGETITITAQGFEKGDQFMVDMRWPLDEPSGPVQEGSSVSIPVDLKQTGNSVSFMVPGHCPAATLKLFLIRDEQRMALCKVSVADGQVSKELQLYGITHPRSLSTHPHGIEQIDLATGAVTEISRLQQDEEISLVVNTPGSGQLIGKLKKEAEYSIADYDLSMNYWKNDDSRNLITFVINGGSKIYALLQADEKHIILDEVNSTGFTRTYVPSTPPPTFTLPDGIKAEALTRTVGVRSDGGFMLLSADKGDGTFSPIMMSLSGKNYKMQAYEPIKADALIPFWAALPVEGKDTYDLVCGFAVVSKDKPNGTELCLWNPTTHSLEAPFATFPNAARSVATHFTDDKKSQELYVLCDTDQGDGTIEIYDFLKKEQRQFPGSDFPYSEIVFAR